MKRLLPLIFLCLLLCGCAEATPPEKTTAPTESVVLETSRPEEYGGAVEKIPLNLRKVHGLRSFSGDLLLFSGYGSTTLTLLDSDSLEELASLTLEIPLEDDDVRFHSDETLSYFDPEREETVVLDNTLTEVRRIAAPGGVTGAPILSGNTLYYCTASHLRSWNLESGIRRIIKEMAFSSQVLTDVLMDGTVLQCTITEGEAERTLFLSSETGQQLHIAEGSCQVLTEADRYYATLPAGYNHLRIYGSADSEPMLLTPANIEAESTFLPESEALVTAEYLKDDRVLLCRYDLISGTLAGSLTLDTFLYPHGIAYSPESLWLLTYDPSEDCNLLLRWEDSHPAEDSTRYASPYYDRDLTSLRREAHQLGERYGIQILIGEEAAETEPWDYNLTAENLPPILRQELALLEERLTHYPEEILRQTAAHFSGLTLCLVRNVSGNTGLNKATGVQFLDGSCAYVAIAAGSFSEQALYHELFHLMETHIFGNSKAFDRWNELNPAGFQYDYDYAANAVRDSGVYLFEDHRAFVDTYSMSFPKEDRARIMEYAMLPGNADLFRTEVMQNKLNAICTGIREAYDLKDQEESFLWEQYLE